MQEAQAIIERIRRVSPTIQRLDIAVNKAHRDFAAGEFFLARTTNSFDPYLREAWIPVERQSGTIVIERPAKQVFTPGQDVRLLGPLGKPIPLHEGTRALLLVAYDSSPAALLMLAQTVLERQGAITLALIGRAQHYPMDALPEEIEVVRADDHASWPERNKTLAWADQIVAVAPPPFDIAAYGQLLNSVRDARMWVVERYIYGLFQHPMPCGVGACSACLVRHTNGDDLPACVEGPAFDLLSVNLNIVEKAKEPKDRA